MFFKNTLFLVIFILITNCTKSNLINSKQEITFNNGFTNKGFALIYSDNLYEKGLILKKIDERSLTIFQKNLKINTQVKVTNILNNKSLIAKVGKKSDYPSFYNSVLSIRIADELDLKIDEPYVKIVEVDNDSMFVAKKAKTHDEEKNVATKAPVNGISINNLNEIKTANKKKTSKKFSYGIKIADFYFNNTARIMVGRIINETSIKNPKIRKITKEKYRVYLGPYNNINSLQNSYNAIDILEFENIEIIRND
jgi:hypothetical protein